MENKQTAMMELLERLTILSEKYHNAGLLTAIQIGNSLLEKEKKQIMLAYCLGHVFHDSNDENAAEFYYNTEYAKTTNN